MTFFGKNRRKREPLLIGGRRRRKIYYGPRPGMPRKSFYDKQMIGGPPGTGGCCMPSNPEKRKETLPMRNLNVGDIIGIILLLALVCGVLEMF